MLFVVSPAKLIAQTLNPPLKDWYKSYFPDEDRNGNVISQIETGEDWFYDFKLSNDINTGKPDGIIAVGYQRYQCEVPGAPNYAPNSYCGTVLYEELRDNIRNASLNFFGAIWFMDLYGNEKWYIDIGNDPVNVNTPPPVYELYGVTQTYDGNIVAVGRCKYVTDYLNPTGANQPAQSIDVNYNRAFVVKVDKSTHQIIWQYQYDMSTALDGDVNHNTFGFDIVEDPTTKNLTFVTSSKTISPANERMGVYEIDENGYLVWRDNFTHYDIPNGIFWTKKSFGTSILRAQNGDYFCAGRCQNETSLGLQSFAVRFTNPHTAAGPTFKSSVVIGIPGNTAFAWDIKELANGKIIFPCFFDGYAAITAGGAGNNGFIYPHSYIYELDPTSLAETQLPSGAPFDLGEFRSYDLKCRIKPTKDGGFILQSTKKTNTSTPTTVTMDDGTVVQYTANGDNTVANKFSQWYWDTDVYLAKFDNTGNIKWENTYPFVDYDPNITNRGEIKEQECLYSCLQHPDGGYLAVGNNTANLDDHVILKTYNECSENISWDIDATNLANTEYHISGNTTWNTNKKIKGTLVIDANYTLTIDGAILSFADTREVGIPTRVIVKKGASLIIKNNSKLTTACTNTMWDGVQIYGDATLSQSPNSNQGYFDIKNSTIEFARTALTTFNHTSGFLMDGAYFYYPLLVNNMGGGIIKAYNTTFYNNAIDVRLHDYFNPTGADDASTFTLCNFNIDEDIPYDYSMYENTNSGTEYRGKFNFVLLMNTKGVKLLGCNFQNDKTDFINQLGIGVQANNSNFVVDNFITWSGGMPTVHRSTFTNLYTGIQGNGLNPMNSTVRIYNTLMHNVRHGIEVSAYSFPAPVILFNDIYINQDENAYFPVGGFTDPAWGIHLTACNNYIVQNNTIATEALNTPDPTTSLIGIVVNNRHNSNTLIYNNSITEFKRGINVFGKNGLVSPADQGLELKCNINIDHMNYDINLQKDFVNQGVIKYYQGWCGAQDWPSGNEFSTTSGLIQLNKEATCAAYKYRHHQTSSHTPINVASGIITENCGSNPGTGSCVSYYTLYNGYATVNTPSVFSSQAAALNDHISALMAGMPNDSLALEIDKARAELHSIESLYFSVLIDSNHVDSIIYYLENKHYKITDDSLTLSAVYIADQNWTDANTMLNAINTSDTDINGRISIMLKEVDLYSIDSTWADVDSTFFASLSNKVGDINIQHGILAQNIYRVVENSYYPFRIPESTGSKESIADEPKSVNILSDGFLLYPNPSNGTFTIKISEEYSNATITIRDISGKKLASYLIENKEHSKLINLKLSHGLYFVHCQYADSSFVHKLIVN